MYKFKYEGFDNVKGKKVKGYMEAYTREEVAFQLNENDIDVEIDDIEEVDEDSWQYKIDLLLNKDMGNQVKQKHILTFTEQLSMHLSAKLPVGESLRSMSKDSNNKVLGKLYETLYQDTVKGLDLSEALKKHSVFDDFFITIVRAGEQSGNLAESLMSLNKYMKTNDRLKSRLTSAAIYPSFIIVIMIVALIAMSYFLVPNFRKIFEEQNVEVNILTEFFFGLSDILTGHPILVVLGVISSIASVVFYFKTRIPFVVKLRDAIELRNPIYNNFMKHRQVAQFAFTLSILLKNAVPFTDALEMSKNMFTNKTVLEGLNKMHKNIMQGSAFPKEMKDFKVNKKQFLPVLFIQLATVGDSTGNLEEPFEKVGEYFDHVFEDKVTRFEKMLEPMIMVLMLPPVFCFVLAIFLPMIKMSTSL